MRCSILATSRSAATCRLVSSPRRTIRSVASATRWAATRYTGILRRRSWTTVSSRLPSVVAITSSGLSATIASRLGPTMPPTRGFCRASGGKSQKSVTPTSTPSAPSAYTISVTLGTSETMRVGAAPSVSSWPCMSRVVNAAAGGASAPVAGASAASRTRATPITRTASAPGAHARGLERGHLGPDEGGGARQMDEQRRAGSLAEAQREVQVRLEPEVAQDHGVAGLGRAMRGEERVARRGRQRDGDQRRRPGDEPGEPDRDAPRRAREDHAREAADLVAADLRQHVEPVAGVRPVDVERAAHHGDLARERRVIHTGAAPGHLLGGRAGHRGGDRAGRRRVADPHLAGPDQVRARVQRLVGEPRAGLDRLDRDG